MYYLKKYSQSYTGEPVGQIVGHKKRYIKTLHTYIKRVDTY